MKFKVTFYQTTSDFKKKKVAHSENRFDKKTVAMNHAKMYVDGGEFAVAVVSSSDKSFTKVIGNP